MYWSTSLAVTTVRFPCLRGRFKVNSLHTVSNVNARGGPGTTFDVVGSLMPGDSPQVVGQTTGADRFTWWQLDDGAWVRDDVVSIIGDGADVPERTP